MKIEKLFPSIPGIEFRAISQDNNSIKVELAISLKEGTCPCCEEESIRIHSKYFRNVADLPWAGHSLNILLKARKFFCDNPNCDRKIFTERMGENLLPYARRTKRLREQLVKIGFATGGNLGASLSKVLGVPISASTILRILHQSPDIDFETPKVLGVDDWAFRKGRTYGTILVDLEKRKPIDLLPDRESSTFKVWLKNHPGVEIISRDRAGSYSKGAKAGAPDAIQVADRWHLLKNLDEALKRMLNGCNKELRFAAKDIELANQENEIKTIAKEQQKKKEVDEPVVQTPNKEAVALSKFHLNFLEVKRLKKEGYSIKGIRRQTGIHRQTIKRYLAHEKYPEPAPLSTYSIELREYEDFVQNRWKEGERNGKQLWREIKMLGFKGSFQSVYRLIAKYPADEIENQLPPLQKIRAWSAQRVSIFLNKEFESLEDKEQKYLTALIKHCPKVGEACELARKFKEMTYKLKSSLLDPWIAKAKASNIIQLKNFAISLENDYEAVKSAVSLEWSNGQVEGQVNRLKTIKRQMYGRAGFKLLRKRVLADLG